MTIIGRIPTVKKIACDCTTPFHVQACPLSLGLAPCACGLFHELAAGDVMVTTNGVEHSNVECARPGEGLADYGADE